MKRDSLLKPKRSEKNSIWEDSVIENESHQLRTKGNKNAEKSCYLVFLRKDNTLIPFLTFSKLVAISVGRKLPKQSKRLFIPSTHENNVERIGSPCLEPRYRSQATQGNINNRLRWVGNFLLKSFRSKPEIGLFLLEAFWCQSEIGLSLWTCLARSWPCWPSLWSAPWKEWRTICSRTRWNWCSVIKSRLSLYTETRTWPRTVSSRSTSFTER